MAYPWKLIAASAFAVLIMLRMSDAQRSRLGLTGAWLATWAFLTAGWLVWAVLLWPNFFSPLRHLPQPPGGSLWTGQFRRILRDPTGVPHREWIETVPRQDGLIRYLGLFGSERLFVAGSKALGEVLVSRCYDFEKPPHFKKLIGKILGDGILFAEGDAHRVQRKNLMPAFAFRHVKDLYPLFWEKSREGVECMTEAVSASEGSEAAASSPATGESHETVIEVGAWASRITLDIIGLASMGKDFGSVHDPHNELADIYRIIFHPNRARQVLNVLGNFLPGWLVRAIPVKDNDDMGIAARKLREICRGLIANKKRKLAQKELDDVDILSVALESGGFTDENLIDQLMTFLAAGHETTATSMLWAIYALATHPDIQARLRAEVRTHLPSLKDANATIDSALIDRLPYLNAVCNEVLRYWSPVAMTIRVAARDTTIQGHSVPKGTQIILCPWAVNFDRSVWGDDAHDFNPDRWLVTDQQGTRVTASGGASSNYGLMTFLHGPRSCIGQAFARGEFACVLAAWIGRFRFELQDESLRDERKIEIKGGITARPAKGMHVRAAVVEGW